MEYVLQKTDIFDKEIGAKLDMIIRANQDSFIKGCTYKLTVSFHVNLLKDPRFEEFNIPIPSKTNKGTKKDKIYDVMSCQLNRMEQILDQHGIEVYSATIQGDNLETESMLKIEICEDTSEHIGKGKNKKRWKVKSIVPSLPYIQENASNMASERLSKMYFDIIDVIKNKKIMSEILEIEETKDDKILYKAFVEQYGELWLATSERESELLNHLKERTILVVNRFLEKDEKA